jgi:hypothetical protein
MSISRIVRSRSGSHPRSSSCSTRSSDEAAPHDVCPGRVAVGRRWRVHGVLAEHSPKSRNERPPIVVAFGCDCKPGGRRVICTTPSGLGVSMGYATQGGASRLRRCADPGLRCRTASRLACSRGPRRRRNRGMDDRRLGRCPAATASRGGIRATAEFGDLQGGLRLLA